MNTACEARGKEFARDSLAVKEGKKAYAKKEAGQVAKEIASYLCRGTRGIRIPLSKNSSITRVDTTCSDCKKREGEVFIVNGLKLCRKCKIKREETNEKI